MIIELTFGGTVNRNFGIYVGTHVIILCFLLVEHILVGSFKLVHLCSPPFRVLLTVELIIFSSSSSSDLVLTWDIKWSQWEWNVEVWVVNNNGRRTGLSTIDRDDKVKFGQSRSWYLFNNSNIYNIIMAHRAIPMIAFPWVRCMFIYTYIYVCVCITGASMHCIRS